MICIAGQMRSGKNVVGEYLCENKNYTLASFAKPVKQIFCDAFGKNLDFVEEWKVKKEPPENFKKSIRQALQFIGDGFRQIKSDVWVEYAMRTSPNNACFTDGRYINELKAIKEQGGKNILLWRPGYENDDSNASESQIKVIVDWYKERFFKTGEQGRVIRSRFESWENDPHPTGVEYVDYFLINDGGISCMYKKLDELF